MDSRKEDEAVANTQRASSPQDSKELQNLAQMGFDSEGIEVPQEYDGDCYPKVPARLPGVP